MTGDSFVESAIREDSESGCEVLFPVKPLLFQAIKLWVGSDLELLASCRSTESTHLSIVAGLELQFDCDWCHCVSLQVRS